MPAGAVGMRTGPEGEASRRALATAVAQAAEEYGAARAYFDCVTEPELVDHAILRLAAAERRYAYLLRRAREAGVTVSWQRR